ncbi:MAG: IS1182 family transposase [Candidatus Omnitrophota bacterium]
MSDLRMRPVERKQYFMETISLEDMAAEDDTVRAIWAFVERLDLTAYYNKIKSKVNEAGSPAYNPKVLLAMWIYAYSQGISSAREVEKLSREVRNWRWLCGDQPINYHTLSDFRIGHKEELDELFTNSLGVLSAEGLVTLERVTQDGTKIRANAGIDTFRGEEKLKAHLKTAREQVELLSNPESEPVTKRINKAKERAVVERCSKLEQAVQEYEKLKADKKKKENIRVSTTDPESRVMKQSNGGYNPSYNAQIAVDTANKIIVGKHASSNCEDTQELKPMVESINKELGKYPKQVITDGGYNTYPNIKMAAEKDIDLISAERGNNNVSGQQYQKRGVTKEFESEVFKYDEDLRGMICPEGKTLKFDGKEELPGRTNFKYRAKAEDCNKCSSKSKCCPEATKKGRSVIRKEYQEDIIEFQEKMRTEEAKSICKKRGENAEFVNACIKERFKLRQFRLRGLSKVDIEVTFAALAYNIMRWFRLRWYPALAV